MRYPKRNEMPKNVEMALKFMGKTGFISRKIWHDHFGQAGDRWHRQQLENLVKNNLIKEHSNSSEKCYYVLTTSGKRLLERHNMIAVWPSPIAQIKHDEVICSSLLNLQNRSIVKNWKMESELKKIGNSEFALSNELKDRKYPDAVFEIDCTKQGWLMALEYERTQKSILRYRRIILKYAMLKRLKLIIFICETPAIEKIIRGQIRAYGSTSLYGRIAFVSIEDWENDPCSALLHVEDKAFSLRDFQNLITGHAE